MREHRRNHPQLAAIFDKVPVHEPRSGGSDTATLTPPTMECVVDTGAFPVVARLIHSAAAEARSTSGFGNRSGHALARIDDPLGHRLHDVAAGQQGAALQTAAIAS
ncbi:MAG: hypothetical protein CM15mP115_06210 [Alphaproteobacteria bacterium]|nr:MAG: hypothetical protein CM15mP115_06210 [Alphaproteobacteria bacterium]